MDCPNCGRGMQWNNCHAEVHTEDYQASRTVEVYVYNCFFCDTAEAKVKWGQDRLKGLQEENARLRAALFCEECGGRGELRERGRTDEVVWRWYYQPCPTCGPLRKELREGE